MHMTEIVPSRAALKALLPFIFNVQVRHLLISALCSQKHSLVSISAAVGLCTYSASCKQSVTVVVTFKQSNIIACLLWQCSAVTMHLFADEGQLYLPKVQTQVRPANLYPNKGSSSNLANWQRFERPVDCNVMGASFFISSKAN